jgi:uncharacterized protein
MIPPKINPKHLEKTLFLDTSYAIALAASSDALHAQAIALADAMEAANTRLVTTQAILLEIGNALAKQRYRSAAVSLLMALEFDPTVSIIPISSSLYTQALQLYCERTDKEWGLVDCISFSVMWDQGIYAALTADQHFQQAGFRSLLLSM